MNGAKVMVVDDEPQTRRVLRIALISRGFEVMEARSGEEALDVVRQESPDIVLLGVKMPGMGGIATCRLIRHSSDMAILMVSAASAEPEKVEALRAGADDFLTRPFGIEELVARIDAITRRLSLGAHSPVVRLGSVEIHLESHEVRRGDALTHLTSKEFKLLYYLLQNNGKVISHRRLLQAVWGPDYGDEVEYLRVFINQLRKKIEPNPRQPQYILTEPSSGYRFARQLRH